MSVQPAVQVREAEPPGGKVAAMESGATNFQYRKVLNREKADAIKILYNIPPAKRIPGCWEKMCLCQCCNCCGSCSCCDFMEEVHKQAEESTYSWIMENRMEFNSPLIFLKDEPLALCCCKFKVHDNIHAIHFDHDMYDYVGVKRGARGCILKCCGTRGDKIKFKKAVCGCPSARYCGITLASLYVTNGEGNDTAEVIKTARDNARQRMD